MRESDTKKEITENTSLDNKTAHRHGLYFSFSSRLVIDFVLFVLFFVISLLFATKTLEREKLDPIKYTEKGDISYKVMLNENDYYTDDYLDMNKAYIANLIKNIDVNFNYLFNIERETTMDFDYKIMGELVIENSNGLKRYFEKEYTILDSKNLKLNNSRILQINENVKIDYAYYNNIANNFKFEYGLDTNSYLNVYLEVNGKTDESLNYKINEKNRVSLKIPLSERAIEINIDGSNQDVKKQVLPTGSVIFNLIFLIAEIIFFIFTCLFLSKTIKYISLLFKRQTSYDKYVNKLLKDYDRLIVESHTQLSLDDYNVINVKNFTELLDVRDNLKVPIVYFNIVKHHKGIFYIKDGNDIYLVTIKDVDLSN